MEERLCVLHNVCFRSIVMAARLDFKPFYGKTIVSRTLFCCVLSNDLEEPKENSREIAVSSEVAVARRFIETGTRRKRCLCLETRRCNYCYCRRDLWINASFQPSFSCLRRHCVVILVISMRAPKLILPSTRLSSREFSVNNRPKHWQNLSFLAQVHMT